VSIETRVWPIDWRQIWCLGWTLAYFSGKQPFSQRISRTLLSDSERYEIWQIWGTDQSTLISRISWTLIWGSRDTMRRHASVLHWCTCKVVFRQLPMIADSFSVVSIHCVARGLGASLLYKCPASRCRFLWQHGLLVVIFYNVVAKWLWWWWTRNIRNEGIRRWTSVQSNWHKAPHHRHMWTVQ